MLQNIKTVLHTRKGIRAKPNIFAAKLHDRKQFNVINIM
jgi:hypothetical protein